MVIDQNNFTWNSGQGGAPTGEARLGTGTSQPDMVQPVSLGRGMTAMETCRIHGRSLAVSTEESGPVRVAGSGDGEGVRMRWLPCVSGELE